MTILSYEHGDGCLQVRWQDGETTSFPLLWLRDNCPSGFHPETRERTFDLLSVPPDIDASAIDLKDNQVAIAWTGSDSVSLFPVAWLKEHRPGRRASDPAAIEPHFWRGGPESPEIPRQDAGILAEDDDALFEWMTGAKRFGLAIVDGLGTEPDAGIRIAERIGFLRQTNFGRTFDVESRPDPNNLAYTAERLPLHTDLPNQETPPGFQFLHCIANSAKGGGSLFCDGFAVADDLRRTDPDAFDLLATTEIPLRFHDNSVDIRRHDTVIRTDRAGSLQEIRFNAHIAGIFDMMPDGLAWYYAAYRRFMSDSRDPRYVITLRLEGGQMVVFDNRRVLHGRDAFDPSTGYRRLRGCYVDRGEWDSRMRMLAIHRR